MKNTRIARLKQSKRVKQATKLLTVGLLVCPLVIGTIKALADEAETTPPVEQVEETPATTEEIVPVEETETIESVQPEVIQPVQPVMEQPTESTIETPVTEEQPPATENVQEAEITPLSDPNVVAEYRAKLADYDSHVMWLRASGATEDQLSLLTTLLGDFEDYINNYENDLGDFPLVWLYDIDNSIIPALDAEIQRVNNELFSPAQAEWSELTRVGWGIVDYLRDLVIGTEFKSEWDTLEHDFAKLAELYWYAPDREAYAQAHLPELREVLPKLQDLKARFDASQTENSPKEQWKELMDKVGDLLTSLEDKVKNTEFQSRYDDLLEEWDLLSQLEMLFPPEQGEQSPEFYENYLPQLQQLLANLEQLEKDVNATQPEAPSTTKLESSIKDAEAKLTAGGYTAESMNALKQALQNAKDILANANSTQAEIDEAQKALDLAIAGLVKEDNTNGGNTGNNSSNGTGNSSNDPNASNNETNNTNNQTNSNQNSTTTTTKPAGNNTSKDGLPQTGEQSATNTIIAGSFLTMLSILAWFKRKKI